MSPVQLRTLTTASLVTYTLGVVGVVLLFSYMIFQARLMIAGPQISLSAGLPIIQHERQIVIEGAVENITRITFNGRPIVTDEEGHFSEPIVLENGYTIVSIKAHDRYGRETTLTKEFVYTPLSLLN